MPGIFNCQCHLFVAWKAFYRPVGDKTLGDLSPGPEALLRMGNGQISRHSAEFCDVLSQCMVITCNNSGWCLQDVFPFIPFIDLHFLLSIYLCFKCNNFMSIFIQILRFQALGTVTDRDSVTSLRWCIFPIFLELPPRLFWTSWRAGGSMSGWRVYGGLACWRLNSDEILR